MHVDLGGEGIAPKNKLWESASLVGAEPPSPSVAQLLLITYAWMS